MIKGTLKELDLGELLKALEAAKRSAVVTVKAREGWGRIHLNVGRMVYARTEPGPHLGEYLVRLGYITLKEVQDLVLLQRSENPGTPLGQLALSKKLITEQDLREALFSQVIEAIATMLGWQEGTFVAEGAGDDASQVPLPHTLETRAAVLEAARRLDEWHRGSVEPDEVLVLAGDPTRHSLPREAWQLLELADGAHRARSLAVEAGLPEEHAFHLLYELKSRGLLRPATVAPEDPLVLVWAESSLVRRLLFVLLERERFRTLIAPNAERMRRMMERKRPAAVLIEGDDLAGRARQVRQTSGGRFVPLWVISEQPPRGLWVRNLRVQHIRKPFEENDVLNALAPLRRSI
ncbi:DUF4388 domain-containing protein [Oceanithermus sp.]|uniref:DUF4388 domain-containing protein n=1 Tax=Oceanithermus sp. TaxID=2268145 RepID=UPI0025EFA391|nr:DUF4388 domain-containing protein [Oceanithermus sp.]